MPPDQPQAGSSGNAGSEAGGCEAAQSWTEAIRFSLQVTWPSNAALTSGEATIELWSRIHVTATGNDLQLSPVPCGVILPEAAFSVAGRLAAGGEKLLIELPDRIWDAPGMAEGVGTGTQSGVEAGSAVTNSSTALLGVVLDDPMAPWPGSGSDVQAVDPEQDGLPGYTALARSGDGYVLPPTGLAIGGSGDAADQVYLALRLALTSSGERTACDAHSGTAQFSAFDTHVVGCRVEGGGACTEAQADFVDQNRMVYSVTSATYEARVVPDDVSCADVRAALPTP